MAVPYRYTNRQEAGQYLARELESYHRMNPIVLGLPRGGVIVAAEVARALNAPLDIWAVRKLGLPQQPELAFGAISSDDVMVFDESLIRSARLSETTIEAVAKREFAELNRRINRYRTAQSFRSISNYDIGGSNIILVDDGLATGLTAEAAIRSLRMHNPNTIIMAVPVAAEDSANRIRPLLDGFVCPITTRNLVAIGAWYSDFPQTSDEDVLAALSDASATARAETSKASRNQTREA
ncbi:phosphoribosyltransferase [Longibacter salinarum]|uniref:Phosphoribosyltransferase n=1 Tax=Longibacter salinarum TaxID=1850348 RepID=A0A2A8CW54_9BACT|nr:phosphoribosyltransferase family protein [Longibacter salinarum]PEN12935.1 phosphoribosyltransferase [Longibacter salinarum]